MNAWVAENADGYTEDELVTIIESARRKVGDNRLTYALAIYRLDPDKFAEQAAADESYTIDTVRGYSKSPASKDEALTKIGTATAVTNKKTGEHLSIDIKLD